MSLPAVCDLEPYWEALRSLYAPFESGLPGPTGRVYRHEIPGGQLSNLRQQAIALGLGEKFEQIEDMYAAADRILGKFIKVTPSSQGGRRPGAGPGRRGRERRRIRLRARAIRHPRIGHRVPARRARRPARRLARTAAHARRWPAARPARPIQQADTGRRGRLALAGPKRQATLNRLLFPAPTKEFEEHRETYGDTSQLSANQFFYGLRQGEEHQVQLERGVELLIGLEAISEPDERGMRTVMCIMNGQLRPVLVRDRSIASADPGRGEGRPRQPRAHRRAVRRSASPVGVAVGDKVSAGETIATIEAMKMEAAITAPKDGTVERVAVSSTAQVEGGDLLVVVSPAQATVPPDPDHWRRRRGPAPRRCRREEPGRPPIACASRSSTSSPRGAT